MEPVLFMAKVEKYIPIFRIVPYYRDSKRRGWTFKGCSAFLCLIWTRVYFCSRAKCFKLYKNVTSSDNCRRWTEVGFELEDVNSSVLIFLSLTLSLSVCLSVCLSLSPLSLSFFLSFFLCHSSFCVDLIDGHLVLVSIDSHCALSHLYLRLILSLLSLYEVLINWYLSFLTGDHYWSTCKDNVLSRSALHLRE